ncbi:TetR family transcriptional regulator C-terminal domain-containing protein [Streptomyces sp. AV19]|uniref:TetR/AcrR family transcriptional regulator n=1 Tax=Streptomyces sp. AV19 TaxID=2793068 RepID=UPI0018FF05A7|nr:TetR family transcriptional regulator C-terminal domain-containing protein [Streptomyces sp. AV19]MBH1933001.1 TetR family transcriptional regulator C-terminal domain-containing protein [Streptomyces sp. AV19]MDG4531713.1 TetR family transcriptional regulator C-terminal domain-containing protein [Streptomyces sp. AV19]
MPKRVDHEERRRLIAEALWRIASTRGLEGASLRDVAAEAGISLGQLQHYFAGKDEMFVFALEYISSLGEQRIRRRITELTDSPTPRTVLRECAAGMLPLDDETRTGLLVGIAYFIRALADERLRRHAQEGQTALRAFFADQFRQAAGNGDAAPGLDPGTEAMLLIALTDGLTSSVLLDVITPKEAMELVDRHLDRLFAG